MGPLVQPRYIIVAEKSSVAKAIKEALKSVGGEFIVTSVSGHLLDLDLPEEYRNWWAISPESIIRLRRLNQVVRDEESFSRLSKIFKENNGVLVVATDNDHEGELIGAEILSLYRSIRGEYASFKRMRFNSTARKELLDSWSKLEDDLNWRWVEKARLRQAFDLITGAAFTRLLTLSTRRHNRNVGLISWGSCQIPTLYFVVKREREIEAFKPMKYWYLKVTFETIGGERFTAYSHHLDEPRIAEELYNKAVKSNVAIVKSFRSVRKTVPRPLPSRTDDVLRDLTRLTGVPASRLLSMMETLYSEGYISYPRTDTNKYPPKFSFDIGLKAVLESGVAKEPSKAVPMPRQGRLDDGAHPPIFPVAPFKGGGILWRIWEYIARRFYANAYCDDAELTGQEAEILIDEIELFAKGSYVSSMGFYDVFGYFKPRENRLPQLMPGQQLRIVKTELVEDETKPPPRLSEAELLRKMEENNIGTDATRASFPSLIVERGYVERRSGVYIPTKLGLALVDSLELTDQRLVTPATRRTIEEMMNAIERGEIKYSDALDSAAKMYEPLFLKCLESIDNVAKKLSIAVQTDDAQRPRRLHRRKK
ncbi:MAG: type IA DNA topoisomerase [Nitrososphaerota archaeon]